MTGNPRTAMVCHTPYLQNEFGDPRVFYGGMFKLQFDWYISLYLFNASLVLGKKIILLMVILSNEKEMISTENACNL